MSLDVYIVDPATKADLFSDNITHNLATMAHAVGIYQHLWRPGEIGIETAGQLIAPLEAALPLITKERLTHLEPSNRWGKVANLRQFVSDLLDAARLHPTARVIACR